MRAPTLATATFLLGIVLAPLVASQAETTSRPLATGRPQKPDFQERLRRAEVQKQARRLVTYLELDDRRAEAANGLLKMGPAAVPELVQAFGNPRPVVVQRVAHILRVLGSQAVSAKERLVALSKSDDKQLAYLAGYALFAVDQPGGITLVVANEANAVHELDKTGKVVRTLTQRSPWDAERLPNGNYLICYAHKHVVEMTTKGEVLWSFSKLTNPYKAHRLPNGNTLIADYAWSYSGGGRVLEVDRAGKTVWKYDKDGIRPRDAERLANGNTLIADDTRKQIVEVTAKGEIVWKHRHGRHATDADRLPNGNTLITLYKPGKVIEVTPKGKVVYELKGLFGANDADRLSNGHTLVAQLGEVAEYDAKGMRVWSRKVFLPTAVTRY